MIATMLHRLRVLTSSMLPSAGLRSFNFSSPNKATVAAAVTLEVAVESLWTPVAEKGLPLEGVVGGRVVCGCIQPRTGGG